MLLFRVGQLTSKSTIIGGQFKFSTQNTFLSLIAFKSIASSVLPSIFGCGWVLNVS